MASILRSSKFVRYIAGFARHVVINTPREFDGNLVNTSQCICSALPRSFVTQASAQHDQNLERSLKRLDQDVRRAGRISRSDIEDVLEEIRLARSASSSQSLLVIRCCGNLVPEELPETRTKLVQEIWNTLIKLNVPMDISHYNALLRVYLENEHPFSPTDFLSELEAKGIEPNRVTYQRLIARYCQLGDIEGATRILEYMKEKQFPVNENVFNALIMGHSQTGDMESAQGILSVMIQGGLEPSADTYTTLLCGYAKKGNIESIKDILGECEQKEVFLLDKDYLDIVYSLATSGHGKHVPVILDKLRKTHGFNQDAVNVILRLINKGHEETALMVLKAMPRANKPNGTLQPTGAFFIRQMVKAEMPVSKIVETCTLFEEQELYSRALLLAAETSLELANEEIAYPLLKELQNRGQEIRPHFFWPLLVAKSEDASGDGIIEVLLKMQSFNVNPNPETLREYVIPHIKGKSSDIIAKLRQANISVGASACHLVHSLLLKNDIEEAALIVSRVNAYYIPNLLKRPLSSAFYKTNDFKSYITILRHMYENIEKRDSVYQEEQDEAQVVTHKSDVTDQILIDLAGNRRQFVEVAEQVLAAVVEQGLSISTSAAEILQDKLGEQLTPEISSLLGKLTSGELTPVPVVKQPPVYIPSSQMNIPQLERLVSNLQAKGQDTKGLKRQLLSLYIKARELEKMEALLKDLDNNDLQYTPGLYAQLIDVYAFAEKLEETLIYLDKLSNLDPNFGLDDPKVIRVTTLLVKNDMFDKAIDFLTKQNRDRKENEKGFTYAAQCWRLLNYLAEGGRAKELDVLFDVLVKNEFLEVNNVMLGPLVKVHLVNDDVDKALEKFEWCCNQFRATPWKNELTCKLIQSEDAERLQKLTDLSTSVHGEINSLYDLVFAFVECGRVRQARKILETPGLQTRPQRINSVCQRYQQEGKVEPLEGLKDATKDLNHIDRSDIYYQLLLSYIKQEDANKALGLWTQMQEEDLAPNEQFLHKLGTFLQESGIDVPFTIPAPPTLDRNTKIQILKKAETTKLLTPKNDLLIFRQLLKSGEIDKAMQLRDKNKSFFSASDTSLLIESLVQADRQKEATELVMDLLDKSLQPLPRVFRFLLNKLANKGEVEVVKAIGDKLTPEMKKLLSMDNRLCHANLVAGKAGDYLDGLEKEIDHSTEADIPALSEKFPRGGALGILEKHPELAEKYENIAVKYSKKGIVAPINVLWCHYFTQGNTDKADSIWKDHLVNAPRIMFQRVVQHAREISDDAMIKKLIEQLKTSKVSEGALGNAYSCLLDILVAKQDTQEAVSTFEEVAKFMNTDNLNRTAVLRVKDVYTKLGKPFEHKLPAKNKTSSNDDDMLESGSSTN